VYAGNRSGGVLRSLDGGATRVVPGRVYIGNSGVVQIDTLGDPGGDNDGDDRVQAAVAGTIWLPDAGRHVLMDLGLGECPVVDPQLIKLALEVLAPSSFRDEDPVRPG